MFTIQDLSLQSIIHTSLFTIAYGLVCGLVCTLFNKKGINHIITGLILFGTAVIFLVEYFVYKYFKIFYDLKTVTGGAGDVVGGFGGKVLELIFAPSGLMIIALFLIPTILFIVYLSSKTEPATYEYEP